MKIKNISPIERHVEKLVFAVAAAASLYLVWSSLSSPATVEDKVVPNGGPVGASEVEGKVADAIKKLQQAQVNTREKAVPTIKIAGEDFVQRYRLSQSEPLSEALLKPVAIFAPRQYEPKGTGQTSGPSRIVEAQVPVVPVPTNLTLSSNRKVVVVPLNVTHDPNTPVNPNDPIPTENKDMSWVTVEAKYPMAELVKAVQSANLPRPAQRVTFLQVQAQRRDLTTNGKWEDVPQSSAVHIPLIEFASVPDEKMLEVLNWYDQRIEDILTPKFFEAAVIAPTTPTVRPPTPQAQQPQPPFMPPEMGGDMPPDMGGMEGPGGPVGPGRPGSRGRTAKNAPIFNRKPAPAPAPARSPVQPVNPGAPGPFIAGEGMPMDPGMMPPGMQPAQPLVDLRTQQQVTIRFHDEHVQPDHEYAYRLRVAVFNPTYRLQVQLKDDPKAVERPMLYSAWVEAQDANGKLASVKIDPNMFLFVSRPITGSGESAQVSIYKWDSGAWQKSDETVLPGQQIGHKRLVSGSKEVDFTTDYTLVDVQQDPSNNILAVFKGANGQLTVRSGAADGTNPKRQELEMQIAPKAPPKTATPGV